VTKKRRENVRGKVLSYTDYSKSDKEDEPLLLLLLDGLLLPGTTAAAAAATVAAAAAAVYAEEGDARAEPIRGEDAEIRGMTMALNLGDAADG
jgi:hypothetical protein